MASSGSGSASWNGITYQVNWTQSKGTASSLVSTVTCTHYLILNSGWALNISGRTGSCQMAEDAQSFTTGALNVGGGTHYLGTTTHKVYHNSEGAATAYLNASFPVRATISGYGYCDTLSIGKANTLDSITVIKDPATVSAGSGTIGSALTINMGRQSGMRCTLTYSFGSLSGTIASNLSSSSYKWTLPTSFYAQIPNEQSGVGTITCATYVDGSYIGSKSTKFTANINKTACQPTLSPTAKDINSVSLAITGDDQVIVKNLSNLEVTSGAAVKNSATIKSIKIACGSKYITTTSGTINGAESEEIIFTLVDSRNLSVTKTLTLTAVDYMGVTCNFDSGQPNINGDFEFSISGNYYNGEFNGKKNTLAVSYRYKKDGGSYTSWTTVTPTIDDNYYYVDVELLGLDAKSGYTFQAKATDIVMTATSREKYVKYIPVFDWGKNDFAINVPLSIQGRGYGENKILWQGGMYMNADHVANLSEPISEQPTGIVLVFSLYDGGSLDNSFNTFFVSKKQVEMFPDCGHTFIMGINAGFSNIGAKYLYFTDTSIKGHAGNVSTGTNSGITFANNSYVLRAVIGV